MTNDTPMNSPEAMARVIPIALYTGGCEEPARAYKTWAWSMAAAVVSMTADCGHCRPVVAIGKRAPLRMSTKSSCGNDNLGTIRISRRCRNLTKMGFIQETIGGCHWYKNRSCDLLGHKSLA